MALKLQSSSREEGQKAEQQELAAMSTEVIRGSILYDLLASKFVCLDRGYSIGELNFFCLLHQMNLREEQIKVDEQLSQKLELLSRLEAERGALLSAQSARMSNRPATPQTVKDEAEEQRERERLQEVSHESLLGGNL